MFLIYTDDCGVVNGDNTSCADCAGVANGSAMIDDCNDCQSAYCYDYVTHEVSFGACDGPTQMWVMPNDDMNPYWNQSCTDCSGIVNGDLVQDECGVCGGSGVGDANNDGSINITDIVAIIDNVILMGVQPDNLCSSDVSGDGIVNVTDIVAIVNIIMGEIARNDNTATNATIEIIPNQLSITSNGSVDGIQLTLKHGSDFNIELTEVDQTKLEFAFINNLFYFYFISCLFCFRNSE